MMASNTGNLWNVKSIYNFQYFNCPSCSDKYASKQDFVNHTSFIHPESIEYLKEISDGSLSDIFQPWDKDVTINVKYEEEEVEKSNDIEIKVEDTYDINNAMEQDNSLKNDSSADDLMNKKVESLATDNVTIIIPEENLNNVYECKYCRQTF